MARRGALIIAVIAVVLGLSMGIEAFVFSDPTDLYSTFIEDQWVYQAHQSTAQLTVFYGEGDYDLLYFERLGIVADASGHELAERSLDLYAASGGLPEFNLERPLREVKVDGQNGVICAYSYQDSHGNKLWEFRIFLVLPNNEGFSLALSGNKEWAQEDPPLLTGILSRWRWLF